MAGKKFKSGVKASYKSDNCKVGSNKEHVIKDVVKSVLAESDILEESVSSKAMMISETKPRPSKLSLDTTNLLQTLKSDDKWLELVSSKVSEVILNNEAFRQIACDSLSLEFQNEFDGLKNEISLLKQKNDNLEFMLDEQEHYSRRNCLLIHGISSETSWMELK